MFVGAAGFVVGAVLGGVALSKEGEAQDIANRREANSIALEEVGTYEDAIEARDDLRAGAGVGLALGGTAIVVGAIMYVLDEPDVFAPPRREGHETTTTRSRVISSCSSA